MNAWGLRWFMNREDELLDAGHKFCASRFLLKTNRSVHIPPQVQVGVQRVQRFRFELFERV